MTNKNYIDLIENLNEKIKQVNYNLENIEEVIHDHYNELRRQVQLDKEIKLQQIEEEFDILMKKIDENEAKKSSVSSVFITNVSDLIEAFEVSLMEIEDSAVDTDEKI